VDDWFGIAVPAVCDEALIHGRDASKVSIDVVWAFGRTPPVLCVVELPLEGPAAETLAPAMRSET